MRMTFSPVYEDLVQRLADAEGIDRTEVVRRALTMYAASPAGTPPSPEPPPEPPAPASIPEPVLEPGSVRPSLSAEDAEALTGMSGALRVSQSQLLSHSLRLTGLLLQEEIAGSAVRLVRPPDHSDQDLPVRRFIEKGRQG